MAKRKPSVKYIGCSIKQLPDEELPAAAEFACSLNPVNSPSLTLAKLNMVPDKFAIAVMTTAFWGAAGVNHTVSFMSQASAALQERILSYLNLWSQHCNAKFRITGGAAANADLRIGLGAGGYWCYLGSQNGRISRNQNNMNLQAISMTTPDAECMRVIPHEAGHYLGCPHEHMRRAIVARLDEQKTIAYFGRTQQWSAQQVRQQVLTPVEDVALMSMSSPTADEDSSMCYGLPGSITKDGRPIVGGTKITVNDGLYMGKIYPLAIVVPPPVVPPPIVPPGPPIVPPTGVVVLQPGIYRVL